MVESDNDADQPKQRPPRAKPAERPIRPRPVTKNSQHQVKVPKVPNALDQRNDKASTQKSNQIRKFLYFFAVVEHELLSLEADVEHIQARDSDNDGNLTDIYTDPLPKKRRTGLVRTYAIGHIPETRPVRSNGDGYETDTEQEMAVENEEKDDLDDLDDDLGDSDDSESPNLKKKKKGDKPKVRDLIEAQRDDLGTQEDMEVSVHHWN
jgi:hypothetical protein